MVSSGQVIMFDVWARFLWFPLPSASLNKQSWSVIWPHHKSVDFDTRDEWRQLNTKKCPSERLCYDHLSINRRWMEAHQWNHYHDCSGRHLPYAQRKHSYSLCIRLQNQTHLLSNSLQCFCGKKTAAYQ